jgi:hypothetical protein
LKDSIPLGFFRISLTVFSPIARIGPGPLFVADFLVGFVDRVGLHLIPLPVSFFGSPTFRLLTGCPAFMLGTWRKKITTINAKDLFHNHLLLIEKMV